MSLPAPVTLGLKKSFGFGDRLGVATPGHLASALKYNFAPIFAQQSIREMARTNRTPEQVMTAASSALATAGFDSPWGADADHLKTPEDVKVTADAGFRFFTIDPSEFVNNDADTMQAADLEHEIHAMLKEGVLPGSDWESAYIGQDFAIGENLTLTFDLTSLRRAAVKYSRAIDHSKKLAGVIAEANAGRDFEIEVSVDETDSPTSALEHFFFGMELKRLGVKVVSLAPRFIGDFEKGVDYKGDLVAFEKSLAEHVAIAKHCGPYKISVHSGSDKFSIYPAIGRVCGELLHVKTAGTSYLEALRVVCRTDLDLFKQIICYSAGRFPTDKATYHISTTDADIEKLSHSAPADYEQTYLNEDIGRQLLHVTFGSVLTVGTNPEGRSFHDAIMEVLDKNAALHAEVLETHFDKHLGGLAAG